MSPAGWALTSIACGLVMGWLNVRLLMDAAIRLGAGGKPRAFVLSSFLRVGACAIVAGVFAAIGPWWSMALYLVTLFIPFALTAAGLGARSGE